MSVETPSQENPQENEISQRIAVCNSQRDRHNRRLNIYYDELDRLLEAEKAVLSDVQSYTINGRSTTRYGKSLTEIRTQIESLLTKIERLENITQGGTNKKVVGVIIRDW